MKITASAPAQPIQTPRKQLSHYTFPECLQVLLKLQQLGSQELQSDQNQQLIKKLEARIRQLALIKNQ